MVCVDDIAYLGLAPRRTTASRLAYIGLFEQSVIGGPVTPLPGGRFSYAGQPGIWHLTDQEEEDEIAMLLFYTYANQ